MPVYDIWDYLDVAFGIIHLTLLLTILLTMGLLVYKDFKKIR